MAQRVVIVGAGLAGMRCAETLRAQEFTGRIQLVGDEPFPPYERPALSKELLAGKANLASIRLRDPVWWHEAGIELLLGRRVVAVDVTRRLASLRGGRPLRWDSLVLATGNRARRLPDVPALRGVHHLRSLQDALGLRSALRPGKHLVIVGAGFVGTEVASTATSAGVAVTLVDPTPPLSRVVGDEVSRVLAARYERHGIELRIGTGIEGVESAAGRLRAVKLGDGSVLKCDAALVAVGARPAALAGVEPGRDGIVTDEAGRTGLDGVYACGDAAYAWHPLLGRHLRVEHWADAAAQGAAVAHAILGTDPPPRQLPLFWSDQFGLRLQYVGPAADWEDVVLEGDGDSFVALYRNRAGVPVAALLANRRAELGRLRQELTAGLPRAA